MIKVMHLTILLVGFYCMPEMGYAQEEEESAELFLEEYSDSFQENFFEALKQKGIENYDKAINLLLKCKQLDGSNTVIDHELAKVYMADKNLVVAEEFAIAALNSEPTNLWYLNTLFDILQKQGKEINHINDMIPINNSRLKENLAFIYYNLKDYNSALNVLNGIEKSPFTEELTSKIKDSLNTNIQTSTKAVPVVNLSPSTDNTLLNYQSTMQELIVKQEFSALEDLSMEAIEMFPVHPFFYYCNGLSLNKGFKFQDAVNVLETALDYWLEDDILLYKIYEELVIAHKALGNTTKVNLFMERLKSRL